MFSKAQNALNSPQRSVRWVMAAILVLSTLAGCDSSFDMDTDLSGKEMAAVNFTPSKGIISSGSYW